MSGNLGFGQQVFSQHRRGDFPFCRQGAFSHAFSASFLASPQNAVGDAHIDFVLSHHFLRLLLQQFVLRRTHADTFQCAAGQGVAEVPDVSPFAGVGEEVEPQVLSEFGTGQLAALLHEVRQVHYNIP